ncbi:MAG TPA: PadR family transcriptional regulator [Candidatus Binatia bacterium]|nr:PadR family transcriptional regulator [Candidatus Binatia bacterium]
MIDHAVLGLLREGPDYAYRLARRLEERMGASWRVSQGQLCRSLGRLRRRGLVVEIAAPFQTGRRRRFFETTTQGRAALERWLARPPVLRRAVRDDTLVRVLLLGAERADALVLQLGGLARLCERRIEGLGAEADGGDPVRRLACEAVRLHTEAHLRWITMCLEALRPAQGGEGQPAGAGVFGCATKSPGRSCLAGEGGLPLTLAGAAAHHSNGPRKRLTATLPCIGSSRV